MYIDPEDQWKSLTSEWGVTLERRNIASEVQKTRERCTRQARKHLRPWISLLDESLQVMLQLHQILADRQYAQPDWHRATLMMGTARGAACLTAIRHLVLAGLEDTARPVTRSYLETLDLTLACASDRAFAERFLGPEESYDPDEFWKAEIAYGRLARQLRAALTSLTVPADQIDSYLSEQREIKAELSGSTHAAMRSAMRSLVVPSLIYEGRYSPAFLGHHSELAPFLLYWVSDRTHSFAEIVVTFLLNELSVGPLEFVAIKKEVAMPFLAAFFVLQDLLGSMEPELHARHDRMRSRRDEAKAPS